MLLLTIIVNLAVLAMVPAVIGIANPFERAAKAPVKRSVRLDRQIAWGYTLSVFVGLLFISVHKLFF